MELKLTNIQKITLRDILTTAGLKDRQVEDVFLLLSFKPERVQLAFYYRSCGETYEGIGIKINESAQMCHYYVIDSCHDINLYLRQKIV